MGKILVFCALSKDGCIYAKDGSLDWMECDDIINDESDPVMLKAVLNRVKYIFMGSKTYEEVLTFGDWSWKDQTTYVFTSRSSLVKENSNKINFVQDDIPTFLSSFKSDGDVWILGGGKLISAFDKLNLVDEMIIHQLPAVIDGIKLDVNFKNYALKESKEIYGGKFGHIDHYFKQ